MIINCPLNKLCSIGITVCECWTYGSMAAVRGAGLDDEGMSSVLALFLDAICKKGIQTTAKVKLKER